MNPENNPPQVIPKEKQDHKLEEEIDTVAKQISLLSDEKYLSFIDTFKEFHQSEKKLLEISQKAETDVHCIKLNIFSNIYIWRSVMTKAIKLREEKHG